MCFTETWLQELIPDSNVTIGGFQTVRADRNTESGKRKGGGLAVLVNNRWCNPGHTHVKERVCNPDIELVAVGLRPYYLPREFTCVIFVVVYIPPTANAEVACDVINTVTARLQTKHPSAFIAISGDFNHVSISTTLPTFHQFVKCPTRENKTLDLLYANAKDAYSSTALPPLGRSDHNLVLLTPLYTPIVQRQPVTMRTVRRWSQEAMEDLRGALEATDWDVLCEPHGDDIDSMVDCVTDYINFCVDNTIPTKDVHCFSNNKPWITSDLKALLNDKKRAFRRGDKEEVKRVQRELKQKLRESKDAYRKKIEDKLQRNRVRDVWSSMREITGFKQAGGATEGNLEMANELNQFFNRAPSVTLRRRAKGRPAAPLRRYERELGCSVLFAVLHRRPAAWSRPQCSTAPGTGGERESASSEEEGRRERDQGLQLPRTSGSAAPSVSDLLRPSDGSLLLPAAGLHTQWRCCRALQDELLQDQMCCDIARDVVRLLDLLVPVLPLDETNKMKAMMSFALEGLYESWEKFQGPGWKGKVTEAIVLALAAMCSLFPEEKLECELPAVLQAFQLLYAAEQDISYSRINKIVSNVLFFQSLSVLVEAAVPKARPVLESQLEQLLHMVHAQVCASFKCPGKPEEERSASLVQTFCILAGEFPGRVLEFSMSKLDNLEEQSQLGSLTILAQRVGEGERIRHQSHTNGNGDFEAGSVQRENVRKYY
ncbi:MROH1 protein, partial [Atractosteus spatula]|nr:MROH1 protein [Atractosteus spatula]